MSDAQQPEPEAPAAEPAKRTRPTRPRLSRQQEQRRTILRGALAAAVLFALQPLAAIPIVRRLRDRLRPPGALDEERFLAACIKCGQCVQVCPVQAIVLADADEGLGVGVPYVDARSQACDFSCDALSCILACPTGALSHELKMKEEVRMGVARLARPEACLARRGEPLRGTARGPDFPGLLRYEDVDRWTPMPVATHGYDRAVCDLCVLECPIGESALRLVPLPPEDGGAPGLFTPEVHRGCTGCGVCQMICPAEPAAIVVDARAVFAGGRHRKHRGGRGERGEHGEESS
ncbi:MAG: 4Fe-4S ferredoxin [Proteobacteria bacterium]|nr:MAG: 4Fe-4S ferredoxin [Pseudomonadota bacterium]